MVSRQEGTIFKDEFKEPGWVKYGFTRMDWQAGRHAKIRIHWHWRCTSDHYGSFSWVLDDDDFNHLLSVRKKWSARWRMNKWSAR